MEDLTIEKSSPGKFDVFRHYKTRILIKPNLFVWMTSAGAFWFCTMAIADPIIDQEISEIE